MGRQGIPTEILDQIWQLNADKLGYVPSFEQDTGTVVFGLRNANGGWLGGFFRVEWKKRKPGLLSVQSSAWFLFQRPDVQLVLREITNPVRRNRFCSVLAQAGFAECRSSPPANKE